MKLSKSKSWQEPGTHGLTPEDLAHYQKIVVALKEIIRLMQQIDEVIEQRGGWPGAFVTGGDKKKKRKS